MNNIIKSFNDTQNKQIISQSISQEFGDFNGTSFISH